MAVCKEHVQYVDVVSNVDHVIRAYLVSENWGKFIRFILTRTGENIFFF